MTKLKLLAISQEIEIRVYHYHVGRKSWNKACGQWLVYGFEAKLGFGASVSLESAVETAWKSKASVSDAAFECLCKLFQDKLTKE